MSDAPTVTVRAATIDDLDRIAVLEFTAFSNPWAKDSLADELARSWARVIVAETGPEGVVAFMNYWRVADEIHVMNVATDPALRRRGYARALMDAMMATARAERLSQVLLEVRASNTPAIALYVRYGFVELSRRAKYYDDGEDALVMVVPLGGDAQDS